MSAVITSSINKTPASAYGKKRNKKPSTFTLNPMALMRRWQAKKQLAQEHEETTETFLDRNDPDTYVPFLDLLKADYRVINTQYLFVCIEEDIVEKLTDLGFVQTNTVTPDNSYFQTELNRTAYIHQYRLYQSEYNLELVMVEESNWQRFLSAQALAEGQRPAIAKADMLEAIMTNCATLQMLANTSSIV